jgi:hypothetical protein
MKFTIEIYATNGGEAHALIYRTVVTAATPLAAQKQARHLIAARKKRRANRARILNADGEELYDWSE